MSWFRSRPTAPKTAAKQEVAVEETLQSEHFQIAKVVRHGFPHQPTALAFDPVQKLLAIGTKSGAMRLIGRPGVDCHIDHESEFAVIQIMFLINEGALVSVCADDQLFLWSLRQKKPEVIHALKFQKERITFCHLPFQSKWLYIGTQRGNVHVLNLESFVLSGYIINWNKAIELIRRNHPGAVIHLSANQLDPNKLLIGYETGLLTLWDLKNKVAEFHYNCKETLKSVSWHHEGKQFICSHGDGSLTTWNVRSPQQPVSTIVPHAKLGQDGKPETCRGINKVELCTSRNSEPFTIFSGGMPVEKAGQTPTLSIMQGSNTTVLEMEFQIVDFTVLCSTPWNNDFQDPYAVIILMQNDFVVVDLTSPNYPCFENPCPMDIHESPVTACCYFSNCPTDLVPAFYSVGCRQKKTGFSEKDWPVKGGEWPSVATSYEEIIITGHADGSIKFWNAPGVTLQVLYKLKTAKMFEEGRSLSTGDTSDGPALAVQLIRLCVESRLLCVAGLNHVTIFRYSKVEAVVECTAIEITLFYDVSDGSESPEMSFRSLPSAHCYGSNSQILPTSVKLKPGPRKWSSGYQPDLCCLLTWVDGEPPSPITSIAINSKFNLMVLGNDAGLAIVDILQKTCLLNIGIPDLYGTMDPHTRSPRSPKLRSTSRSQQGFDGTTYCMTPDDMKSPNFEQPEFTVTSPTKPRSAPCFPCETAFKTAEISVINEQSLDSCDEGVRANEASACEKTHSVLLTPLKESSRKPELTDVVQKVQEEKQKCKETTETTDCEAAKGQVKFSLYKDEAPSHHVPHQVPHLSLEMSRQSSVVERKGSAKDSSRLQLKMPPREGFGPPGTSLSGGNEEMYLNSSYPFAKRSSRPEQSLWSPVGPNCPEKPGRNGLAVPQTAPVSSKVEGLRLAGKVNRRLKNYLKFAASWHVIKELATETEHHEACGDAASATTHKTKLHHEFQVIDLTSDDLHAAPVVHKLSYLELSALDKTDGSTFSRSQSSSMSSLDNVSKESVQCLTFGEVTIRKSDGSVTPCLWAGTSLGSVLVLAINLPSDQSARRTEPVSASPSGIVFRLKGSIQAIAFLDANGVLLPIGVEPWRDPNRDEPTKERRTYSGGQQSNSNLKSTTSLASSDAFGDRQFAVLCSEKQARVIALPSQTCAYKVKVTETLPVVRADVVPMRDGACLACYIIDGRIVTFSLPSLKPLLSVDLIAFPDVRVGRTLCFSCNGNTLYFCSPSELQKIMLSADLCENLSDMLGELFVPCDMPEPPKQGFFRNFFNVGSTAAFDREELFGERSGKPARGVATYVSGISQTQEAAGLASSEIGRAKQAALERGEKLGELEERTTQMMLDAEQFAQRANQMKNKYKDRKWYQF